MVRPSAAAPNFAFELCVRRLARSSLNEIDLSTWKVAFCGAEPVRLDTMRRFGDAFAELGFPRDALYPCYGLAEATVFVSGGNVGEGIRTLSGYERNMIQNVTEWVSCGGLDLRYIIGCGIASGNLWQVR